MGRHDKSLTLKRVNGNRQLFRNGQKITKDGQIIRTIEREKELTSNSNTNFVQDGYVASIPLAYKNDTNNITK